MKYSKQTYEKMFDLLLSQELYFTSYAATEHNIKCAMKKVLGQAIKANVIKGYGSLVLSESLDVYVTIKDPDGEDVSIILYYGR